MIFRPAVSIAALLIAGSALAAGPMPVAPDHSLATAEYVAMGAPKPDHPWTADDYALAVNVLTKVQQHDPMQLPRAGSMRSGLFFRHLVGLSNLKTFDEIKAPMERAGAILALQQSVRGILTTYIAATNGGQSFDTELIDAMQFLVAYTTRLAETAEELAVTFSKDDPTYQVRMDGLQQMRSGILDIADGAVTTLGEHDVYRLRERLRFAKSLERSLPPLVTHATPEGRARVLANAEKLAANASEPEIREAVAAIVVAIKAK